MKVSVIIPTYKRPPKVVMRAINSVINQTYKNIEIIIIDDSPSSYEERDKLQDSVLRTGNSNIIYIQNKANIGASLSRNIGIETATGEFITFLDDDDEYLPEKIEHQLNFMLNTSCDMSFTKMIMYDETGKVVDVREHNINSFDNNFLLKYHLCHHMTGTPTFMIKKEKLQELGGFINKKIGEEFLLMLHAIEKGFKIGYIPECHVKIYKHKDGGLSQDKDKITGEKELYNFKKNYFPQLTKKEQHYVKFRHHAIMAVAYKRNRMYAHCILSLFLTFFVSPGIAFSEGIKFVLNINKQ